MKGIQLLFKIRIKIVVLQKLKKSQVRQKLEEPYFLEVSGELNLKIVFEQILIKINIGECAQTPTKEKVWIKESKSFHMLTMKVNYFPS